jgi:hypothetical protein
MTGKVRVTSQAAWRARLAGRAPRIAVIALVVTMTLAGARSVLVGPPEQIRSGHIEPARDLAAESFAEQFVRAYLTWDTAHPERHEQRVGAFISDDVEPGAGLSVPTHGSQQVVWTATTQDRAVSRARRLITVAAETTASRQYVSVSVQRDRRGFMAVSRYPALVGAPPVATDLRAGDESEVEDPQLQTVVRRAIGNYLGREGPNLRADLEPGAVVALPATRLDLTLVDTPTWIAPRRVAVEVRADGNGAEWTLRYELDVSKRDRWYVRAIQTNPTRRESQ